jgi:hypothetical protein
MESIYESIVLYYLTHEGKAFVSPQFSIKAPTGKEWSTPDFLVLDFARREVQVVEVSVAANVDGLVHKVEQRDKQWINFLHKHLADLGQGFEKWPIVVRVFVRGDSVGRFNALNTSETPVRAEAIEDMLLRWKWPWGRS